MLTVGTLILHRHGIAFNNNTPLVTWQKINNSLCMLWTISWYLCNFKTCWQVKAQTLCIIISCISASSPHNVMHSSSYCVKHGFVSVNRYMWGFGESMILEWSTDWHLFTFACMGISLSACVIQASRKHFLSGTAVAIGPREARKIFLHLHFSVVWIGSHCTFVLCTTLPRPYLAMGQGGHCPPPEKLASEYNKILFVHNS